MPNGSSDKEDCVGWIFQVRERKALFKKSQNLKCLARLLLEQYS